MDKQFLLGIEYFNNGYFFEAHDVFEEMWMAERGRARTFYQGLVQIATGFYHLGMGNKRGAASQLGKGKEKLTPFTPAFRGLDVERLLHQVNDCSFQIGLSSEASLATVMLPGKIPLLELTKETI